ncbi:MAG: ComEC family competence protein [Bacteroidales bacterium]|nr:ComEC family competence protein [Bacteroidales bacterium]
MKFLAVNPFIRLVVPLIVGILLQHHFQWAWFTLFCISGIFILGLALFSLLSLRQQFFLDWLRGLLLGLLFITAGSALLKNHTESQPVFGGEKGTFLAEVTDIPLEKPRSWQSILRIRQCQSGNSYEHLNTRIMAYFQKTDSLAPVKPGDMVIGRGYIHPIQNYGNPEEFDYRSYMASRGIHHQCYLEECAWSKVQSDNRPSLTALSNQIRSRMLRQLDAGIRGKNQQAVAAALLLGYKGGLTPDMKSRFSASGTMHILAVSGLHVGIIYLLFHHLLVLMDRSRHGRMAKTGVIIVILAGYAFLTGLSPSVCRATLMFSVIALGRTMRRDSSTYNSLAFSAFLLLVINPMLIFSVSFQLSYAAVASIAFFQPRLYSLMELQGIPDRLWQWLTLAVAAQIGAAPLIIRYFHTFPNYFWLANFIAIPAATVIIVAGIGYLIAFPILPAVYEIFQIPLNFCLQTLTRATGIIEKLPFSSSRDLWISTSGLILFYMIIALFTAYLIYRRTSFLKGSLALGICSLLLNIGANLYHHNQQELIIYHAGEASAINYRDRGKNLLYMAGTQDPGKTIRFHIKNYWLSRGERTYTLRELPRQGKRNRPVPPGPQHFFEAGDLRLAYLHGNLDFSGLQPRYPLRLDYIILAGDANITIKEITRCFRVKKIILDGSNSYYQRHRWIKRLRSKDVQVHSIPEHGAFQVHMGQKIDKKIGLL